MTLLITEGEETKKANKLIVATGYIIISVLIMSISMIMIVSYYNIGRMSIVEDFCGLNECSDEYVTSENVTANSGCTLYFKENNINIDISTLKFDSNSNGDVDLTSVVSIITKLKKKRLYNISEIRFPSYCIIEFENIPKKYRLESRRCSFIDIITGSSPPDYPEIKSIYKWNNLTVPITVSLTTLALLLVILCRKEENINIDIDEECEQTNEKEIQEIQEILTI